VDALEAVPASALTVGDTLRLGLGERAPADAVLLAGATWADEACTSGESAAVHKRAGDTWLAGSINLGSPVRLRVLHVAQDSHVQQMAQALQQALTQRTVGASDAERWSGPFLAGVLLLALLAGITWAWVDPSRVVAVVCAVLIVTCPCALALAAPAARVASTAAMARRGVMVQRLSAWDALARITCVALDKTGTLTQPEVRPCVLREAGAAPQVAAAAAALAAWSKHPLSAAVVRALPRPGPAWRWAGLSEVAGAGLRAQDPQGRWWRLGSAAWVCEAQGPIDLHQDTHHDTDHDTHALPPGAVLFGPEGEAPWLAFEPFDAVSPQAQVVVTRLQALGLRVRLLSGDQVGRVQALAHTLGLKVSMAQGGCSPQDKQAAVRAWTQAGQRVLMVGDGVNDAPVLAQADAAVAVGGASALASRAADAVLLRTDLSALPDLLLQARRTRHITRQNLVWATVYNVAAVPLAVLGHLPPWAAGLGMALSSALVVGNAMRLSHACAPARHTSTAGG
jgi:P-type Cu2+ transporter